MLHEALQPLLAPVVIISACGLMIMAMNARAMSVMARIRQLHHERLEISELAGDAGAATRTQRLRYEGVGSQSTNLLSRLRLMRGALMMMVGAVVLMLASSVLIGLESIYGGAFIANLAIAAFVAGILGMFCGALTFLLELRLSLNEITYEHDRIMGLGLPDEGRGEAC